MRGILAPISFLLLLSAPRVGAAQEFNNPFSVVFDVSCDFDEDGLFESSFEVSTFLNPTGTGRDLASQSTFTAMSGIAQGTLNGETIFVTEIPERRGRGLRTVACEAAATLIDADGNVLVLTITDATFLVTPPGRP